MEAELRKVGALSKTEETWQYWGKGYNARKHNCKGKTKNYGGQGKKKKIHEETNKYLSDLFTSFYQNLMKDVNFAFSRE